jgi:hypothetical protein
MGTYFFGFIGAFVRWVFKGFKGRYIDVWHGPKSDDLSDNAGDELINNIIGMFVFFLLAMIIFKLGL